MCNSWTLLWPACWFLQLLAYVTTCMSIWASGLNMDTVVGTCYSTCAAPHGEAFRLRLVPSSVSLLLWVCINLFCKYTCKYVLLLCLYNCLRSCFTQWIIVIENVGKMTRLALENAWKIYMHACWVCDLVQEAAWKAAMAAPIHLAPVRSSDFVSWKSFMIWFLCCPQDHPENWEVILSRIGVLALIQVLTRSIEWTFSLYLDYILRSKVIWFNRCRRRVCFVWCFATLLNTYTSLDFGMFRMHI